MCDVADDCGLTDSKLRLLVFRSSLTHIASLSFGVDESRTARSDVRGIRLI